MEKIKLFFKGLFLILIYFILYLIIYLIFSNKYINNLSTILCDLLILFIFIIIFRKNLIPDFYDFKKNYKKYLKESYIYWLIGLGIMIISNILIGFIIEMPTNEELNRITLLEYPLSSIISMVIVAPIIEELITRKTFRDVFDNEYIYMIISGLIFGSLHLLAAESIREILYIIPYGVLGAAFAKIYYKTNNIWTNIFFHSLHNFIAIITILGA